jgi:hypothetical protein
MTGQPLVASWPASGEAGMSVLSGLVCATTKRLGSPSAWRACPSATKSSWSRIAAPIVRRPSPADGRPGHLGIFPVEGLRKTAGVAACRGEWILELDADEAVPPELADEVRHTIDAASGGDWYQVPVDNFVGDRLVRHGWGGSFGASSVARLFRKGVKTWKTERVHPGTTFTGVFGGRLENPILHKVDDDIADMVQRLNRYTACAARTWPTAARSRACGTTCSAACAGSSSATSRARAIAKATWAS